MVTNLIGGSAAWRNNTLCCARSQAEGPINRVRLILHTAACWLPPPVRDAIRSPSPPPRSLQ
jgi:hypothetical protein